MIVSLFTNHYIEIAYIICAMLGGIMHWLKKSFNGETDAKITQWFGTRNLPATIYTLTVFLFAIIGSLAGDIINSQTGFWAAMYTGFVTGFAIDAGFNRDIGEMNRDLIRTRDEIHTLYRYKSDEDIGSIGVPHYGNYHNDEGQDEETPKRAMTIEERRAELRKKLG